MWLILGGICDRLEVACDGLCAARHCDAAAGFPCSQQPLGWARAQRRHIAPIQDRLQAVAEVCQACRRST